MSFQLSTSWKNVGIHVRTYKFKVIFDVYYSKLWICSKLNRTKYQASSCTLRLYAIGVWVGRNTWIKLVSDLFILQLCVINGCLILEICHFHSS